MKQVFACIHTIIIWMYMYVYECITLYMYVYACIHVYMHVYVCISDCGPLSRVSQARAGISGAGLKMAMLHTSLCHHLIPKISLPQAAIGIVTRPKRQVGAWRTVCAAAFGVAQCLRAPFHWNLPRVGQHCAPCTCAGQEILDSPRWTLLGQQPAYCLSPTGTFSP